MIGKYLFEILKNNANEKETDSRTPKKANSRN
jgi:hypothetical protein